MFIGVTLYSFRGKSHGKSPKIPSYWITHRVKHKRSKMEAEELEMARLRGSDVEERKMKS